MLNKPFKDLDPSTDGEPNVLEFMAGKDALRVDRLGAKVSLKLGGVQILNGPNITRSDGKLAVTHPCSPNFGPYGSEFDLPKHGPVRDALLDLIDNLPELSGGKAKLGISIESGSYPAGVNMTQEFELQNNLFRLTTIHENRGESLVPVVSGEHFYWSTDAAGWEEVTVNGENIASLIRSTGHIGLKEQSRIVIPNHAVLQLNQSGYRNAILWTYSNKETSSFDRHYFCLEPTDFAPADFGEDETLIHPGQRRKSTIEISLVESLT